VEVENSRQRYTHQEDVILVGSYIHVSEDAAIGTNQTDTTMWERIQKKKILQQFLEEKIVNVPLRSATSYKSRFHDIQTDSVDSFPFEDVVDRVVIMN